MEQEKIANRVSNSSLRTLDLEDYIKPVSATGFDMGDFLFQRTLLKEKEFRQQIKEHDWTQYDEKSVYVHCSEDAIIPSWAYMLVVTKLEPHTQHLILGGIKELLKKVINESLDKIPLKEYVDAKTVIKGCGDLSLRDYAYFRITQLLLPHVASLMYGEPCSTVPVYKRKK